MWWTPFVGAAMKAYTATVKFMGARESRLDQKEAESIGAAKQREENQQEAIRTKDEQLEEAINAKRGDGGDAADRGVF